MVSDTTPTDEISLACDASVVTAEQKERWVRVIIPQLYKAVQEIQELPDGYAWRLPPNPEVLMLIAEDLNIERLCCPFVHYTLSIEPDRGPFWLRMTGNAEVKTFLRMAFESANIFDEQVAHKASFNLPESQTIASVETAIDAVDRLNERFASERPRPSSE